MKKNVQIHYTFDYSEVNHLLESKGYYLSNGYTYNNLIFSVVEIFLGEYSFIDCEYHVLASDEDTDVENGEIEYTIFNILAFYTELKLHSLKEEEVVSDIYKIDDKVICIQVHNLEKDNKKHYYVKLDE